MSNLIDSHLIGQSIKALRLKNHLTQDGLAYDIGYSTRNLRRIETDGTTSIEVVNTFAEYFNVSALDILNGCFLFNHFSKRYRQHIKWIIFHSRFINLNNFVYYNFWGIRFL